MPSAHLVLRAQKSRAYFESLCKHFGRKVKVMREGDNSAIVAFAMGQCKMSVDEGAMYFEVSADDATALETVKHIVDSHAVRFGELKEAPIEWRSEAAALVNS